MGDDQSGREGYPFRLNGGGPPWWFRAAARLRGGTSLGGRLAIAAGLIGAVVPTDPDRGLDVLTAGWLLLVLSAVLDAALPTPRMPARPVHLPIRGRWRAQNSPANRVPSHRTHAFGQTFAIDLGYRPEDGTRSPGKKRAFRPPDAFPGFGQEILAPCAGRVVTVRDGARDHRSRSTDDAIALIKLEGFVRWLGGMRYLAGNIIVVDLGDGVYASLGHLKRRSATVKPGQQVEEGEVLARCGNSGNSSEPHLHFQLTDHPRQLIAAGLPFVFTGVSAEASPDQWQLPRNGEIVIGAADDRSLV